MRVGPSLVTSALCIGVVALGIFAGNAGAAQTSGGPGDSRVTIEPFGLKNGRARIMSRINVAGNVSPYRAGQRVRVAFFHDGNLHSSRSVKLKRGRGNYGTFSASIFTKNGRRYGVQATYYGQAGHDPVDHSRSPFRSWDVSYVRLRSSVCSRIVEGFRRALNRLHMVPGQGRCFDGRMERAVLAYRKVNRYARNARASKSIVRQVFNGLGRYHVRRKGLGKSGVHVEAELSRQILVFARRGQPTAIFPTASGKASTPTVLGTYTFYRKDPGFNSNGMYFSSYFIRGYAIHGYAVVPDYPASHGCLRTFLADQPRIYGMTRIGMPIHVLGDAFRSAGRFRQSLSPGDNGPDLGPTGGLDPAALRSASDA